MVKIVLITAALTLLFALADRFSGAGWLQALKDRWNVSLGRPIYYAAAVTGAALWLVEPPLVWFAIAFLVWRLPGWRFLGGDMDPENLPQTLALALRHCLIGVPLVIYALVEPFFWLDSALSITASFAVTGAVLGLWMGLTSPRHNGTVEWIRGGVYGYLIAPFVIAAWS